MHATDIRPAPEIPRLREFDARDVGFRRPGIRQSGPSQHRCKDGRIIAVEVAVHPLTFTGTVRRSP